MSEQHAPQPIPEPRSADGIDAQRPAHGASRLQVLADAIVTAYAGLLCVPVPPTSEPVRH